MAWVAYPPAPSALRSVLFALRVAAVALVVALLLDAQIGVARPQDPLVALDASASLARAGDGQQWAAARDSASAVAGTRGDLVLFGDSVRSEPVSAVPGDAASLLAPVFERAAATGRSAIIITDGLLDDPDVLRQAPAGSRVIVIRSPSVADLAIADVSAPAEGRVGDTIVVSARVIADAESRVTATLRWSLDARPLAEAQVPALSAGGEAVVESRLVIPVGDSTAVLRAALQASSDQQPRNDTMSIAFRRGARQRVVVLSTAPDADVRDIAAALRANVSLPTDVFYRIAPSRWVRDGSYAPIDESVVRAAVRGATLAVLHGDTLVMGAPTALGARSLLLLSPPGDEATERLVRPAPSSPLSAALAGLVVDSLPPLLVAAPARGGTTALAVGTTVPGTPATPVMTASDGAVRRVVLSAAGYSRWRARGGVNEVAFQALIGGATDWLLAARGGATVPVMIGAGLRAGIPVRWRRGAQSRAVSLLARDGDRRVRQDTILFGDAAEGVMPPLTAGVWRGTIDGSPILVPVSASREWLPAVAGVRSGSLNGDAVALRRGARSVGWLYLATVLLLAAEWLLRRRAGLR